MENRTIKFRAWDGKKIHNDVTPWRWDFVISNTWHRCEKSTGAGILGSGGDTAEMLVPAIRFKEVMEFTGLKDKNGKEIYEGDIVLFPFDKDVKIFTKSHVVRMDEGYWKPLNIHYTGGFEIEVIGNIYEHPELLAVTQTP